MGRGPGVTLFMAVFLVVSPRCLQIPASTGSRHFYPAEFPLSGLFFHGQQRLKMCKMQMEHPKRSGRRTGSVVLSESSTTWEINALVARSACILRPLFRFCLKTCVP